MSRPTLLCLTSGPYFWTHQRTIRAKYEALSERFQGFILSFVCRGVASERIGDFDVVVQPVGARLYANPIGRAIVRAAFFIGAALRLHWTRRKLDVIVACDPFMTGVLGLLISWLTGARLVVELNGDYLKPASWSVERPGISTRLKLSYVKAIVPFVLKRAAGVKLCYPGQGAAYAAAGEPGKCRAFHEFVPLELFRSGPPTSGGYVLFVGHPWYTKGVDVLINAFNSVSPDCPDVELRIVGYLPERDAFRPLYDGNPRIRFTGPVMPDDVIGLMAGCRALVLPSRSEAMGRVILEAWGAGKPVIASRAGGIPCYVHDGETGLLFDSGDVAGLAHALKRVLTDRAFAGELGRRGHEYAVAELSEARYVEHLSSLVSVAMAGAAQR
jgi:glycosyltransferase involved in cell wall biosynthesis